MTARDSRGRFVSQQQARHDAGLMVLEENVQQAIRILRADIARGGRQCALYDVQPMLHHAIHAAAPLLRGATDA